MCSIQFSSLFITFKTNWKSLDKLTPAVGSSDWQRKRRFIIGRLCHKRWLRGKRKWEWTAVEAQNPSAEKGTSHLDAWNNLQLVIKTDHINTIRWEKRPHLELWRGTGQSPVARRGTTSTARSVCINQRHIIMRESFNFLFCVVIFVYTRVNIFVPGNVWQF